jgi:DNA invertase Pin-like site-specific DNA recombinase
MPRALRSPATGHCAWVLAVVSSEAQADTLQHQIKWAHDAAKRKGWRITRTVDGVASGKLGPRKIVRELIADLRTMEPAARPAQLLMIRTDRLGRGSVIEAQVVLRDILDLGVRVFTRDDGEVRLDSGTDELISAAKLAVARIENDVRSDKARAVVRRKLETGEAFGRTPYGLQRKGTADVIDPERAPVVREAFKMRLGGAGYDVIGKRLRAIAPPHHFKNKSAKNPTGERIVHWGPQRVSRLLSNRRYVGSIIDEATYVRAQRVASILTNAPRLHERKRRYDWPLTGALRCYCGAAMSGIPCGAEPWRYRYYACKARWNHGEKLRLVRSDNLEEQFSTLLGRLRASPSLITRYRKRASTASSPRLLERSLKQFSEKLSDVDRRRDAAWELHVAGRVRSEDVQERLDKLSTERSDLQAQIAELRDQLAVASEATRRNDDVQKLFERAPALYAKATEPQQRQLARAVAVALGGFTVNKAGKLQIGAVKALGK